MIYYEDNVVYRTLDFMGYPKYRIGIDGSLWTYKMDRRGDQKPRWKKLKGCIYYGTSRSKKKYLNCVLKDNGKEKEIFIHCLVLLAFVGPRPEGYVTCHENDDGLDNRLDNLRWGTHTENSEDLVKNKPDWMLNTYRGENHPKTKLTNEDVLDIRNSNLTYRELSAKYKIANSTIGYIKNKTTWKHI